MDIMTKDYFEIEEKIKKIKSVLNDLEHEKINIKFNEFINKNIGNDKNIDELIDFDNFLKSKNFIKFYYSLRLKKIVKHLIFFR